MSITSDVRSYADTAASQGKQVFDQAQAQLTDLRTSAEKSINVDAIKSAIEPYLAQVKDYQASVYERAENLISGVKTDPRVSKLVDTAGTVSGVVVETVQERVVKPVQSLTGRGSKPTAARKPATKSSSAKATKPAATKPATKPATTKPAAKPAARKAPSPRATKA